jgi:hypothetical protein
MTSATAFGWESATACDAPSTSVTVMPARVKPNRWTSGLIVVSAVGMMPHDGLVRHAAAAAGSSKADAASGR